MKNFRRTGVATAVVTLLSAGVPGIASAYEYGMSHINVQNFLFTAGAAIPDSFTFDLANTATLNATTLASSASCGGIPGAPAPATNDCGVAPVLDATVVTIGAPVRAENNYTFIGTQPTSYASSDSIIRTAQLVTGGPTTVEAIAEVNVEGNGNARANSEIQSNTTVTFTVQLGDTFDMTFEADPDLRAAINSLPGVHSAQANLTTVFSLTNNDDDSIFVTWSPQGDLANNCQTGGGITCIELNDGLDLNRNVSTGTNPSDVQYSHEVGNIFALFGIRVSDIPFGTYSLALSTTTSSSVRSLVQQVPEPASLALIGLGLLGMGVGLRRRNRYV